MPNHFPSFPGGRYFTGIDLYALALTRIWWGVGLSCDLIQSNYGIFWANRFLNAEAYFLPVLSWLIFIASLCTVIGFQTLPAMSILILMFGFSNQIPGSYWGLTELLMLCCMLPWGYRLSFDALCASEKDRRITRSVCVYKGLPALGPVLFMGLLPIRSVITFLDAERYSIDVPDPIVIITAGFISVTGLCICCIARNRPKPVLVAGSLFLLILTVPSLLSGNVLSLWLGIPVLWLFQPLSEGLNVAEKRDVTDCETKGKRMMRPKNITVYYDAGCRFCRIGLTVLQRLLWVEKLRTVGVSPSANLIDRSISADQYSIEETMYHEHSWIIEQDGRRYLRFQAFIELLTVSPIAGRLVSVLSFQPIIVLGEFLYRKVAANRQFFSKLTRIRLTNLYSAFYRSKRVTYISFLLLIIILGKIVYTLF